VNIFPNALQLGTADRLFQETGYLRVTVEADFSGSRLRAWHDLVRVLAIDGSDPTSGGGFDCFPPAFIVLSVSIAQVRLSTKLERRFFIIKMGSSGRT
jgi:hypothetical protein